MLGNMLVGKPLVRLKKLLIWRLDQLNLFELDLQLEWLLLGLGKGWILAQALGGLQRDSDQDQLALLPPLLRL